MNLSLEELALVETAQKAFADAKAALAKGEKAMEKLARINREAKRSKASNDAMWVQGRFGVARTSLIADHATASNMLCDCYEDGGIVVFGGGGGR